MCNYYIIILLIANEVLGNAYYSVWVWGIFEVHALSELLTWTSYLDKLHRVTSTAVSPRSSTSNSFPAYKL